VFPVILSPGGTTPDSSGNPNILVGQHATGVVSIAPDASNQSCPCGLSNFRWNVSGTTFQSWSPTTPPIGTAPANSQASYFNGGPIPATNPTSWYWNDLNGASETVSCTVTVTPPAGTGSAFDTTVNAPKPVNVVVPSWTAANSTGYGYVGYPNSSQALYLFAGPSAAMQQNNQTDGSVWITTVSSPLPIFTGAGQWGYAQIINPGENFVLTDGSRAASTDSGVPALDNTFPYEGTHALDGGKQKDGDAPALPLNDVFAEVFMTDQFKTYLMFRPSGSNTSWVPLAETGWNPYFDAKKPNPGGWANFPQNTSTGSVLLIFDFKAQNVFPSWNKVLAKGTALFH
jgi:hypothetical protein